jgi:hypothetical protein
MSVFSGGTFVIRLLQLALEGFESQGLTDLQILKEAQ